MKIARVALVAAAVVAVAVGSAAPSDAKAKKKPAADAPMTPTCWLTPASSVCGSKGSMKFTYFNACYASKDGATVASQGDCKPAKAMKSKKKMKM
jgi:hypothetical protein